MAYPRELAERLATALDLDGSGRLLDVGCGPGCALLGEAAGDGLFSERLREITVDIWR